MQELRQRLPQGTIIGDLELTSEESYHKKYKEEIYPELIRLSQHLQQEIIKAKKIKYEHEEEYEKVSERSTVFFRYAYL